MKFSLFYLLGLIFLFFGCKSTKNIEENMERSKLEDIFKIEDEHTFTNTLFDAIVDADKDFDIHKLSKEEQVLPLLYVAQGYIDNGGFQYFFDWETTYQPDYQLFVDAYEAIGSHKSANAIRKVLSLFKFEQPHLNKEKIYKVFESLEQSDFDELEKDIMGGEENFGLLEKYLRKNKDKIIESILNRKYPSKKF